MHQQFNIHQGMGSSMNNFKSSKK